MKRPKRTKKTQKFNRGYTTNGTLYVIVLFTLLAITIAGGSLSSGGTLPEQIPDAIPLDRTSTPLKLPSPEKGRASLQLYTFQIPTPTLTPIATTPTGSGNYCEAFSIKTSDCQCIPSETLSAFCQGFSSISSCVPNRGFMGFSPPGSTSQLNNYCLYQPSSSLYESKLKDSSCTIACYAKPAIYLYSPKPTTVDVEVRSLYNGIMADSDPPYSPSEGWKNVFVNGDGTTVFQGKNYHELFYAFNYSNPAIGNIKQGMVIAKADLRTKIAEVLAKLGLLPYEQREFLEFYMPILDSINSPYFLLGLVHTEDVIVSPKPDTYIEANAYFKALSAPISITPLSLPAIPPDRSGFTVVNWGGFVDVQ